MKNGVASAAPRAEDPLVRFGVFELDRRSGELRRSGALVRLKPQAFKVLALLVAHAGKMVTRDQIRHEIWGDGTFVDFDQGVNQCIRDIRAVLADEAEAPRYVETLPRVGYRFIAPVEMVGVAPPWQTKLRLIRSRSVGRPVLYGLTALTVAAVLFAGRTLKWPLQSRAPAPTGRVVLAVLPFQNLGGDPEQDYLVDGLTEEVITQLGRLDPRRLAVIARSSAMTYKGTKKTAAQVARELKADYILEGSVRRAGDRVRISTRLVQAHDETNLWAQSYERELPGIFEVQSEVAQAVAYEIQLTITPQHQARIAASRPANQDALEAYLRGRYFWNKRTQQALIKGIEYFRDAIEKDPNYASAYSGLADSYIVLGTTLYAALPPKEAMPQAKSAAQKALTIDPTLAEAHTSVAFARFYFDWDWPAAETEFRRAIELNPNYSTAHQWYALLLTAIGRRGEALAEAKKGQELDPLSQAANAIMGRILYYAGQHQDAIERLQRTVELYPDSVAARVFLGLAYERRGNLEEAITAFQTAVDLSKRSHSLTLALLGQAYGTTGRTREAMRILEELEALSKHAYVSPIAIALVYAGLRNKEQAFRWLEKAYEERSVWLVHMKDEPVFDTLRDDSRFAALAKRVGLN